jgi:hypothetical protein
MYCAPERPLTKPALSGPLARAEGADQDWPRHRYRQARWQTSSTRATDVAEPRWQTSSTCRACRHAPPPERCCSSAEVAHPELQNPSEVAPPELRSPSEATPPEL